MQCHPGGPQDGCSLPPQSGPFHCWVFTQSLQCTLQFPAPIPSHPPHSGPQFRFFMSWQHTVSRAGCNLPYQGGQANVDMCADTFPLGRLSVCVEASLAGQGGRSVRWSEALHLLGSARVPLVPSQGCLLPTRWNQPSGRLHCSSPIGHITALSQSF